jgi:hypothetical protein
MPKTTPRVSFLTLVLAAAAAASFACRWSPPGAATPPPDEGQPPSPTAELPPAELPTETSLPATDEAPGVPPGWLTYHNEMLGYEFDYPPEAALHEERVTGYPTEELPAGLEPGQYIATLEATYTEGLCVSLLYGMAYVYIGAPDDLGGRYSTPCGISGIGVYDLVPVEETLAIGGDSVTATGNQIFTVEDHTFVYEFFFTSLADFRFNYGGDWTRAGSTYDAYLADKAVILQVLETWRWIE